MPTEAEKKRRAELEKWLVKVDPEVAKTFREGEVWWDEQEDADPKNQKLKKEADAGRAAILANAKERAKLEAPGREKGDAMIKAGDAEKVRKDLDKLKERINLAIDHYWNNYGTALTRTQFGVDANTPEEIEDEQTEFLEALARKAFSAAIDIAGIKYEWEGAKEILGVIAKSLVDLSGDIKGKKPANGKAELNSYIDSLANSVEDKREQMKLRMIKGSETVGNRYESAVKKGKLEEAKTYVETVSGNVERFSTALETYTIDHFKQQILTVYVKTKGRGDDGRPSGMLYFSLYVTVEVDPDTKITLWGVKENKTSSAWKLVTKHDNPEGLAKTLIASLGEGNNRRPVKLDLQKVVFINIEFLGNELSTGEAIIAGPGAAIVAKATNKHMQGAIVFTDSPGNFKIKAPGPFYGWVEKAWKDPELQHVAVGNAELEGSKG